MDDQTSLRQSTKLPVTKVYQALSGAIKTLGPGLITGAADDDPSGIATYSSVGAQFGFGMLWTMPLTYPFMTGIQEICARLGRVTGKGIAANMLRCYPRWVVCVLVGMLLFANVINLGADIGAMGAAVNLLIGGPSSLYCILMSCVSILFQVFIPYKKYAAGLKWLTFSLFAYVGAAFAVEIDWAQALKATVFPHISLAPEYLSGIVAVFGTTISPYLFFWQSAEEVEEMQAKPRQKPLRSAPRQASSQFQRIRVDTCLGMAMSNLIGYFIILTVAVTLNSHGQTRIDNAAQAAEALRPIAGPIAGLLFAAGIVGTGLLALPVLAGSAAYAVCETFKWPASLERKPNKAKAFYAILTLAMLVGMLLNFANVSPISALVWAATINGITAAPLMCFIMLIASNRRLMGKFVLPRYLKILGWTGTGIMFAAAVGMFLHIN